VVLVEQPSADQMVEESVDTDSFWYCSYKNSQSLTGSSLCLIALQ